MPVMSAIDRVNARLAITREAQNALFRCGITVMAIGWTTVSIIYPIGSGDRDRPIWAWVYRLGSPWVVLVPTLVICASLALALWLPRIRLLSGLAYGIWLSFLAVVHWTGYMSCSMLLVSFLGTLIAILGAEIKA